MWNAQWSFLTAAVARLKMDAVYTTPRNRNCQSMWDYMGLNPD